MVRPGEVSIPKGCMVPILIADVSSAIRPLFFVIVHSRSRYGMVRCPATGVDCRPLLALSEDAPSKTSSCFADQFDIYSNFHFVTHYETAAFENGVPS